MDLETRRKARNQITRIERFPLNPAEWQELGRILGKKGDSYNFHSSLYEWWYAVGMTYMELKLKSESTDNFFEEYINEV